VHRCRACSRCRQATAAAAAHEADLQARLDAARTRVREIVMLRMKFWLPQETRDGLREAEDWRRERGRLHFQVLERFREQQRQERTERHFTLWVDAAARRPLRSARHLRITVPGATSPLAFGGAFSWWRRNCVCFNVLTACLVPTLASPRGRLSRGRRKVSQSNPRWSGRARRGTPAFMIELAELSAHRAAKALTSGIFLPGGG
jgi:hypothetical protein